MEPRIPDELDFIREEKQLLELFVSSKCSGCQELMEDRKAFDERFAGYEIFDITESMANLRHFLSYRDKLDGFQGIKDAGKVGIPSVVTDGVDVSFPGNV